MGRPFNFPTPQGVTIGNPTMFVPAEHAIRLYNQDTGFEGQWNENVRLWYNLLIIIQYTKVPFQGPFRML